MELFGIHYNSKLSVDDFIYKYKTKVVQCFVDDLNTLKKLITAYDKVIIHSDYRHYIWSNKLWSIKSMNKRLKIYSNHNVYGFVIHLPNDYCNKLEYYKVLSKLIIPKNIIVFLETPSVKPLYNTIDQLYDFFKDIKHIKNIGLCVDTAHLWASGVDISSYKEAYKYTSELHKICKHIMFHINDNKHNFGSGIDNHINVYHGSIWYEYRNKMKESGLAAFLKYIYDHNCICVLERSKDDLEKIDIELNNLYQTNGLFDIQYNK